MKKRLLALVSAIAILLSGCQAKTNSSELEEFTIVLDWYPNAVHTFIYTAIDKGYYEEEGLKVNIQFPSNTNDAIWATAAGKVDAGIYYLHDLIVAKANQDVAIKSIGAICQSPLNIFLSLEDKNILEPKDLIGKTIGYSGGEVSEAVIQYFVEKEGGNFDGTTVIDVGFDLMSSMTTGNVDVTLGSMVNHEVPQMEKEGFEVNYFYPSDYGIPDYYELILITGDKQIEEQSEKLLKFIRASQKGFEDVKKEPEKALEILIANQEAENFPLDMDVERKSLEILLPVMEEEILFLSQSSHVWAENVQWLYDVGIAKKMLDVSDIAVDLEYLTDMAEK